MKRLQKLTFFIEKRTAVEPLENDEEGPEKDGERSEESSISIKPDTTLYYFINRIQSRN